MTADGCSLLWDWSGPAVAFSYGAALALLAAILFRATMWIPPREGE
jgi:hypothetical protein